MSSTERAPEPTMEEILASIRRIISDDETNSAPRKTTARTQDDEGETAEGEADDRIINDIARVLSSATQPTAEEDEEDILDLTSELGGLEIVEEEIVVVETVAEVEAAPMAFAEPEFAEPDFIEPDFVDPAPEAQEEPRPEPEPQFEAAPPEPAPPPPPMSASEEAASALERAIAALRAGQLPTSISEFTPKPLPEMQPSTPFYVAPQPEPEPAPQPEFQAYAAPEPEPELQEEPDAEFVLSEFETEALIEETAPAEEPGEAEAPPAAEEDAAPWASDAEPMFEPERTSPQTNGHDAEEDSQKTLEDSVKDMLRPMLQRWLDENMTRVLTSALKDELKDNPGRFRLD